MPDTTRTFIAVALPEALEPRLARLQAKLAAEVPEGRWDLARPYHITLAFLGNVGHGELNDVCLTAAEAASVFEPFELALTGLGAFPSASQPRVVWAGIARSGRDRLMKLQAGIVEALARLGHRPDSRSFQPHLALGRFSYGRRPTRDLTPVLNQYNLRQPWCAGPFAVTEVVVFGSTLTPDGPIYAPLGRGRLKGRNPDPSP